MMTISNNVLHALVVNYANAMPTSGTINVYSDLANDGQIALVNHLNAVVSPASIVAAGNTYYDKDVRFVVRNGTNLVYTPWFQGKDVANAVSVAGVADTQQVTYIGYNGTSGSLDVFDLNEYIINIEMKDEDVATAVYPYMKHGTYFSDSTATEAEVGLGLVSSLIANFKREHLTKVQVDLVCSAAGTEALGAADTAVGSKGSKILTVTETGGVLPYAIVAGDYVRIGTATTAAVYKVITATGYTAADGGTLVLDRELVADVSVSGTGAMEYITAAQAAASTFGIKLTALARTNFVPGVQKHYLTTFKVFLARGFETTEVTYTTAAAYGKGTYQEVAEVEYLAQGNSGKKVYIGVPPFVSRNAASAANLYDTVVFNIVKPGYTGMISNNPDTITTVYLYTNDDNASPNNELKTILGIS